MRPLIVFGTRPEAIKLAPVVLELRKRAGLQPVVCATAQHRQMLDQVLDVFAVRPDIDLDLMRPDQDLAALTAAVATGIDGVIREVQPDVTIVQGDTTTAFAAGLASFYRRVPVAHVEAGLRTYRRYAPFPEEINRRCLACFAQWHLAPTVRARQALLAENIPDRDIHVVGNTVIDALLWALGPARDRGFASAPELAGRLRERPFVLITGHRRENLGGGLRGICQAIAELAAAFPDWDWVYPVHLNPRVRQAVQKALGERPSIHLLAPQGYLDFVWLMDASRLILTDSGGVQEEAPTLGKPVLVLREATERPEAVAAGVAALVGTDRAAIVAKTTELLADPAARQAMTRPQNPYGDGTSARRIVNILTRDLVG